MKNFLLISLGSIMFVASILLIVDQISGWPPLEAPPRQSEALDPVLYDIGQYVHSEKGTGRVIREPQNFVTNLAFILAGAYLVSFAKLRVVKLVGVYLVAVGIGSALYHAAASRTIRHLDVGSMYALFVATTLMSFYCLTPRVRGFVDRNIYWIGGMAAVLGVLGTLFRNFRIFEIKPFALTPVTALSATILISTVVLCSVVQPKQSRIICILVALLLFAIAVVGQIGDRPGGFFSHPDALIHGHSIWHVCSAMALAMACRLVDTYVKDEEDKEERATSMSALSSS